MEGSETALRGPEHEFPCAQCGAKLQFAPGAGELTCPYCGHAQAVQQGSAPVVEQDFHAALRQATRRPASEVARAKSFRCNNCGAVQTVQDQSTRCAFCDSPVVVEEDDPDIIVPQSLLPFGIEKARAKELFTEWLASLWFAPSDLEKRAKGEGMDGVYVPYWTYDSYVTTSYTGQRGDHYYETEYYTDSEGNRKSRQVRKTRWRSASGTVRNDFDDVLVCASRSLPQKLFDQLEPWDLHQLQAYSPDYLSGFRTERYAIDLEEGFGVAQGKCAPAIDGAIRSDIGGDEQRIHHKSSTWSKVTFKHTLLPLWISSFRYKEKVYRVLVNARTGEVAAERPWSALKITLAVLGGLLLIAGIVVAIMLLRG